MRSGWILLHFGLPTSLHDNPGLIVVSQRGRPGEILAFHNLQQHQAIIIVMMVQDCANQALIPLAAKGALAKGPDERMLSAALNAQWKNSRDRETCASQQNVGINEQ